MGIAERRTRDREARRRQILDAARQLFVEEGFDRVSMRKLAERIEYSPMALYQYFASKEELLHTLCEETFADLSEQLLSIWQHPGSALDQLRAGLYEYVRFGLAHPQDYLLTFLLKKPNPPADALEGENKGASAFDLLRQAVRRAVEAGEITGEVEGASQALWAAIHGVTSLLLTQRGFPFVEQEQLVRTVIETMLAGLRPSKTEAH